jgi:glycosyltransferase involved in cell wall biosynthesis
MRWSIVIPALNERATLRGLVERLVPVCDDLIVVDDGSTDGTAESLSGLPVTLLRHASRKGKGVALKTGFAAALARGADAIMTMDADGQHSPDDAVRLIAAWRAHPDCLVIGARTIGRERQPALRHAANTVADWFVSWASGRRVLDSQSGHRVYTRRAAEIALGLDSTGFEFEARVLIACATAGLRWVAVPIEARYAPGLRRSHFAPVRDAWRIAREVGGQIVGGRMLLGNLRRIARDPVVIAAPGP